MSSLTLELIRNAISSCRRSRLLTGIRKPFVRSTDVISCCPSITLLPCYLVCLASEVVMTVGGQEGSNPPVIYRHVPVHENNELLSVRKNRDCDSSEMGDFYEFLVWSV